MKRSSIFGVIKRKWHPFYFMDFSCNDCDIELTNIYLQMIGTTVGPIRGAPGIHSVILEKMKEEINENL